VAGTDGSETFRKVFYEQARLAVILFRPGWGETRFTRVEEAAIRDKVTERGWAGMFLVRLAPGKLPVWIPGTYIYFDPASFGLTELVGAVKARCAELGATVRSPSPAELARVMADRQRFDKETRDLLTGNPWPAAAGPLFAALDKQVAEIARSTGWEISHAADGHAEYIFYTRKRTLQLLARREGAGMDSHFFLHRIFRGRLLTKEEKQRRLVTLSEPDELLRTKLTLRRLPELGWCWEWEGQVWPSEAVAERLLNDFLNRLES
jgi:hypothetical protein